MSGPSRDQHRAPAGDTLVARGAATLRRGGVVVFPTDTVYGVGCRLDAAEAVQRIYEAKGRPAEKALPVLVSSRAEADRLADLGEAGRYLAARFWPGPLTLVARRRPAVPNYITAGQDTVAVRFPDHPLARQLIATQGGALPTTSANRSGEPAATTAEEARRQLGNAVDLVIDGGPTPGAIASTIVDVTTSPPTVLRPGAIAAAVREALAELGLAPI